MSDQPSEAKKKILIIEDDPQSAILLTQFLKLHEYETFWAKDGIEGIRNVEQMSPDLIFLDIMLPQMSGIDVLKILKSKSEFIKIPVIMCTVLNKLNDVEKCYEAGAAGYITKPYEPNRVLDKINSILKNPPKT